MANSIGRRRVGKYVICTQRKYTVGKANRVSDVNRVTVNSCNTCVRVSKGIVAKWGRNKLCILWYINVYTLNISNRGYSNNLVSDLCRAT